MIDLQDKSTCPTLEEIGEYVRNPVFMLLCSEIRRRVDICRQIRNG